MKIAIFLFLVLMNCSTLFAYEVKVTRLTDEYFDPLPNYIQPKFGGEIKDYQANYQASYNHKQIATMTLIFELHEIGEDFEAVLILVQKEAAILGADLIIYVSETFHKNSREIASMTFRCARTDKVDKTIETEILKVELFESSLFFKIFCSYWENFNFGDDDDVEWLKKFGLEKKQINSDLLGFSDAMKLYKSDNNPFYRISPELLRQKSNTATMGIFDTKTGIQISEERYWKMEREYITNQLISFYKENFELYKSEYDKIMQVNKKYPNSTLYFPKLDSKGNIDYEKMKNDLNN